MQFQFQRQFVLQWPMASSSDYVTLIELEKCISTALAGIGVVVGNDFGAGEMNIFVLTNEPLLAFQKVLTALGTQDFMPEMKAAYRDVGRERFTILYPANLLHFAVA